MKHEREKVKEKEKRMKREKGVKLTKRKWSANWLSNAFSKGESTTVEL